MSDGNINFLLNVVRNSSIDTPDYSVSFDPILSDLEKIKEENGTRYFTISAIVRATDKFTAETVELPVEIVDMPEYTQSGYIIRGKNKQIIADYAKAKGWYLNTLSLAKQKTSSKSKSPKSIKLDPQGGMALTIEAIDYILYIRSGHKQSEYKMPLANFLKALTGMTFDQLEARIADDNIYCVSSFMGDEPSRVLCIEQSIKTLLTHYQGGKKDDELYRLSDVAKYNLLYSAILDSRGIFLGGSSIPRTKKLFSFSYRANGLYLEEDINFQGVKVDKGVLLDLKTLSELDSIELNTLKVSDTKNFFTLRKDVPNTFRALNMTLEEDIDLVDVKLTKGRVLDVVDLKSLNNSNISSILVSYGGRPFTMTREVLTGRLSVSNLIGAIQVYLDFLAGLDLKDDVYGLSNQILRTIDLMAATIIKDNCDTIIQSLVGSSFENDTMDALTKTLNLKPVPTNGILKYAESADSIEVHHAELNNTIQKASKTKKVSKRTTASSVEMTSIQQSQFGILDALEGPESSRLGTVHSLTFFAKMEEDGYLTKAVIKVNNGEIEDELPVFLTASDLEGEYIAEWNETFYNHDENGNKTTKKDKIFCMSSTTFLDVPVSEVRYKQVGPFDNFSISRTQAPYTEHNQLKRLVMSGNHAKQAKTVLHSQRAFVSSGGESLFASEGVIKASELITTFYNTNKDKLNLEQEDLEKLHLKLCTVERITGFKVLTLEVMEFPEEYCSARIPHMQKSSSGSLFSYEINTRTNLVFGWDDIIAANIDIDLGSYDIDFRTNFGHMKVDEKDFEIAIGTSRNLTVAFKTHESSTMDDSITISSAFRYNDQLSSIELEEYSYKLSEVIPVSSDEFTIESFGTTSYSFGAIQSNGLPKLCSLISPGDTVIVYKKSKQRMSKGVPIELVNQTEVAIKLEGTQAGHVVDAYIVDNKATVVIARIASLHDADKLTGRHGNKGVIARFVDPADMPFDPVTGLKVDIILNPLGIPSRMNVGQLLEARMGLIMKNLSKIHIVTPYFGDNFKHVMEMSEKYGVKPMKLVDGRTGKYFDRPINVGNMYIWVSEHASTHKIKYVGMDSPLDPIFFQPSKGKGGQALGEMETWALEGAGTRKLLQDAMSVDSDDLDALSVKLESLAEVASLTQISGENHNDIVLKVFTRVLGCEPQVNKEGVMSFIPLTDDITRSLNVMFVDPADKKSLSSPIIFGDNTNVKAKFKNRDRWGWVPLGAEIVHPTFIYKGDLLSYLLVGKYEEKDGEYKLNSSGNKILKIKTINSSEAKSVISCELGLVPLEYPRDGVYYRLCKESDSAGYITGMTAFITLLKSIDFKDVKKFYKTKDPSNVKDILKTKAKLSSIESLEEAGIKLTDFIITTLPVMPKSFRPDSKFSHAFQDFDHYYAAILDAIQKYKLQSPKSEIDLYSIFARISELCGYGRQINSKRKFKTVIEAFSSREDKDDKHGYLREHSLKKRQRGTGRAPIIPSTDMNMPIDVVGIPFEMVVGILKAHLLPLLIKELPAELNLSSDVVEDLLEVIATNKSRFLQLAEMNLNDNTPAEKLYDFCFELIKMYVEGYKDPETGKQILHPKTVILGRQPTLHIFGIRGLKPRIVMGKGIQLNTMLNKGFNADHDGDQGYIKFIFNHESAQEVMDLLSPKTGVLNPKDRSINLDFTQDMKLGMYYATILKNNIETIEEEESYKNIKHYRNPNILENYVSLGEVSLHDLVTVCVNERFYLSTAGRILLNARLEDNLGFTEEPFKNVLGIPGINPDGYNELRFDGVITGNGKGLSKKLHYISSKSIIMWSFKTYSPEVNLKVLGALSSFGFKYSDLSGISLSLEDLEPNTEKDVYLERANEISEKINNNYLLGLSSEEDRKQEIISLYQKVKEKVKKVVLNGLSRNNSIFLMLESGARGNEDQIMQLLGVIGVLQKSKSELLENPIVNNYTNGITDFQTQQITFSTRMAVASTQNETSNSGELTRLAVYVGSNIKILSYDCGAVAENVKLDFLEPTGKMMLPDGTSDNPTKLIGKKLLKESEYFKYVSEIIPEDRTITEDVLDVLIRRRAQWINCEDGMHSVFYKPEPAQKSQLLFRYTEEKDLPGLILGNYISEETIDYIYKTNKTHLRYRNTFQCKEHYGVCTKCFGLTYESEVPAPYGKNVGVIAAQSVGEPASQLTMNLSHAGGQADKSVDKGVETYKSILKTGFPVSLIPASAMLSNASGYVNLGTDGKISITLEDGKTTKARKLVGTPVVMDKEYVDLYQPLTSGLIRLDDLLINPPVDVIRYFQMALLRLHFNVYDQNKIDVLARHFEILVRNQLGTATIYSSSNPEYKEGKVHPLMEVLDAIEQEKINAFIWGLSSSGQVISTFGGITTSLVHEDFSSKIGKMITTGHSSKATSFIGNMAEGLDVSVEKPERKFIEKPKKVSSAIKIENTENTEVLFGMNFLEEIEDLNQTSQDIDWDNIFDINPSESFSEEKEAEIILEDLSKPSREEDLKESSSFGGK